MDERITVAIEAETNGFNRGIDGVVQKLGGTGTLAVAGAALAAGAAITAFTVKALTSFSELETGMGEVFTLMPGMSEDAMNEMTEDVQAFARATGNLTDDVVPALYDSISAGVPAENVFGFLETANMLAVGGVTDLNTAVDGLTSSVNSYGSDILSAQHASDVMFTAVKNGKTTVDELAGTLGRVTPTAAAMGVSFEEINAAIATTTAMGIQTSESVSGLKAVMSNLLKPSGEMLRIFEQMIPKMIENGQITGDAADQFLRYKNRLDEARQRSAELATQEGATAGEIKAAKEAVSRAEEALDSLMGTMGPAIVEGAGFAGALGMIEEHAMGGRDGLGQVFGSVEALNTVLAITSDEGMESFDASLVEMQNSTGATEAAFETMTGTLSYQWDLIKAKAQSGVQDFGQALAPIAATILMGVNAAMDNMRVVVETVTNAVASFFRGMTDGMGFDATGLVATIVPLFESLRDLIVAVFQRLVTVWENDLKPAWEVMEPTIGGIINAILAAVQGVFEQLTNVFNLFAALLTGDWAGAWEATKAIVETTFETLANIVTAILTGLEGSMTEIWNRINAWLDDIWQRIRGNAERIWNGVRSAIEGAFDGLAAWVQGVFDDVAARITGVVDGIIDRVQGAWDRVSNLFSRADRARADVDDITTSLNEIDDQLPSGSYDPLAPSTGITIPGMATGGIVTGPTLALIGEAGAEAVIPLSRLEGMLSAGGGAQTIIVELDGETIARSTVRNAPSFLRMVGA